MTEEDLKKRGLVEISPGIWKPRAKVVVPNDPVTEVMYVDTSKLPDTSMTLEKVMQHIQQDGIYPYEQSRQLPLFVFNITPMGKPRMNASDFFPGKKQRPIALRYFAWCDQLRKLAGEQNYVITERMNIIFYLPFPKNKKKRALLQEGSPCKDKPDYDNCCKAINDALTSDRYAKRNTTGDQHIWDCRARKLYSDRPRIEIYAPQD